MWNSDTGKRDCRHLASIKSVTLRAARTSGRQCVDTASGLSPRRVKEGAYHQKHHFGELKSSHMDRASHHRTRLTASKSS